jgi:hypothetical protein
MNSRTNPVPETALIHVSSFRKASKPRYSFSYETNEELYSLGTDDTPQDDFTKALEDVTRAAAEYFGLDTDTLRITPESITWNEADSAVHLVVFNPETKSSSIKVSKTGIPKLPVTDTGQGLTDPSEPRNVLNEALEVFREKCVAYLHGDRMQQPLPFPAQQETDSGNDLPFGEAGK